MLIRIGHLLGWIIQSAGLVYVFGGPIANGRTAPALPARTVTYRFTACIKDNAGITPFKVGETIKGTFTYDLDGKNERPDVVGLGRYRSKHNAISFQVGDLCFKGVGDISASVTTFDSSEHFGVVAPDLQLPEGWEMDHTQRSQTYSFLLQNAPPKEVIANTKLPKKLSLSDFVNTQEVRLDFYHGVKFPGGQVKDRATVYAVVESLEEVSP